ncbi:MAG: cupin domain-containing protein [Natrialbaceae archaeon]|nr:cupin domain-containing protein [Natrialbaceae archaeon]
MDQVNKADIDWSSTDDGLPPYKRKHLSGELADADIGCSLYQLAPGDRSWPYHFHTRNAEAMYVLEGSGRCRHPEGETEIAAGDFISFPPSEDGAHRLINDGERPLVYLAVSTMAEPDITVYPDSSKFGVYVGSPPGGRDGRSLEGYYNIEDDVEYWTDEE